ncbi:hypothetical protein [Sphingomonas glacialis]|uniref:hypothetical protein n=1 Tax=Sphingomonas glacialis TaxID=658225 RepID=UPI0013869A92|nr:hypothetical protein [Sphingomonas glacialis]
MKRPWLVLSGAFALAAWEKSVKGNYNMPIGQSPGIVATLGDKTFSLDHPASFRLVDE